MMTTPNSPTTDICKGSTKAGITLKELSSSGDDYTSKQCDHRPRGSSRQVVKGHAIVSGQVSKKTVRRGLANDRHDSRTRTLSYFSGIEDSADSSNGDDKESSEVLHDEEHQKSNHSKIAHRIAVPVESDHEDASSTSSCSCEDHGSVADKSEDDPHGDLDYDDDSVVSLNDLNVQAVQERDVPAQPSSSARNPSKLTDKPHVSETDRYETDKAGTNDVCLDDRKCEPTKIRSFINHDRTTVDKDDVAEKQIKVRSHKSYHTLLEYFFKDSCFFQIKSVNHENVAIAKRMGVWSTPIQNEIRFNMAFREHRNVILIFSVQQSGAFQGFARMISESKPETKPIPWVLPQRLSRASLGGVFRIQWLCKKELNFNQTRHLHNPFNNYKPVKIARDGQQVESKVAEKLVLLFPRDSKRRLLACVDQLKIQIRHRKELQRRNNFYPPVDVRTYRALPRNHHNNYESNSSIINGARSNPSSSFEYFTHPAVAWPNYRHTNKANP